MTQSGSGSQFDVWFDFSLADPYANSLQCPIGTVESCFLTNGGANANWTDTLSLLPGVLHAYAASLDGYVMPMPEPGTWALFLLALAAITTVRRKNARSPKD